MYKYILESAGNINWMAVFALTTFVSIFCISAYLVFKKDKEELNRLSSLPLTDDNAIANNPK